MKAIVAVGRSQLVIIWHLLANPENRLFVPERGVSVDPMAGVSAG